LVQAQAYAMTYFLKYMCHRSRTNGYVYLMRYFVMGFVLRWNSCLSFFVLFRFNFAGESGSWKLDWWWRSILCSCLIQSRSVSVTSITDISPFWPLGDEIVRANSDQRYSEGGDRFLLAWWQPTDWIWLRVFDCER
jgi:hypothetical protein